MKIRIFPFEIVALYTWSLHAVLFYYTYDYTFLMYQYAFGDPWLANEIKYLVYPVNDL